MKSLKRQRGFFTMPGLIGTPRPDGGSLTDHHETITYVGDATYPRALSTTVDVRNGIFWGKDRDNGGTGFRPHIVFPSDLGTLATHYKPTDTTTASASNGNITIAASSLTLTANAAPASIFNTNSKNFVLWLMKRQAGFLDVVTYTGNASNRSIAHGLGVAPGFVMIFKRGAAESIFVGHRAMTDWTRRFQFNGSGAESVDATVWNSTAPDSSNFYLGTNSIVNGNTQSFTALLFGHDTGSSGRIQCGSYAGNGSASGPTISLGWNPRWVMLKNRGALGDWRVFDTTRSPGFTGNDYAQTVSGNAADSNTINVMALTGSGFQIVTNSSTYNGSGVTHLYVAIR